MTGSVETASVPAFAKKALERLNGGKFLCRSYRPEASGFEFFTEPGHEPFPETSAEYLISNGLVTPQEDGLFEGFSQTFKVNADAR